MPWPVTSSRVAYENRWIRVIEDRVLTPDGRPGLFGVIEVRQPAVFVVALTDAEEVLLVEIDRHTVGPSWEVPAGGTDGEEPLVAARRELLEETGFVASSWTPIGRMEALNGVSRAPEIVFLATGLRRSAGDSTAEPHEVGDDVRAVAGTVRSTGGDVRSAGGDIRSTGDDVRAAGDEVRSTGDDVRAAGDDVRSTGDDVRATGDDVRAAGDEVRSVAFETRHADDPSDAGDAGEATDDAEIGIPPAPGALEEGISSVRAVPFTTVLSMVADGTIRDGETVAAVLYAALHLGRVR
ncbi:NTP pyrophosphohydrolase (modular protein) [Nostocoides japonicum T1-X7]|uniref:NTP pyrophosphohydrolase (Modular protein) n=1 Tax=Nostocoides japonicum T1-X7 TaxID=1194083 RepID=A0A077M3R6_9MICO|nr:NTP pyrophosphohydrolase (modular protein) [Tetrasphaera japonica T1-X7]